MSAKPLESRPFTVKLSNVELDVVIGSLTAIQELDEKYPLPDRMAKIARQLVKHLTKLQRRGKHD